MTSPILGMVFYWNCCTFVSLLVMTDIPIFCDTDKSCKPGMGTGNANLV